MQTGSHRSQIKSAQVDNTTTTAPKFQTSSYGSSLSYGNKMTRGSQNTAGSFVDHRSRAATEDVKEQQQNEANDPNQEMPEPGGRPGNRSYSGGGHHLNYVARDNDAAREQQQYDQQFNRGRTASSSSHKRAKSEERYNARSVRVAHTISEKNTYDDTIDMAVSPDNAGIVEDMSGGDGFDAQVSHFERMQVLPKNNFIGNNRAGAKHGASQQKNIQQGADLRRVSQKNIQQGGSSGSNYSPGLFGHNPVAGQDNSSNQSAGRQRGQQNQGDHRAGCGQNANANNPNNQRGGAWNLQKTVGSNDETINSDSLKDEKMKEQQMNLRNNHMRAQAAYANYGYNNDFIKPKYDECDSTLVPGGDTASIVTINLTDRPPDQPASPVF